MIANDHVEGHCLPSVLSGKPLKGFKQGIKMARLATQKYVLVSVGE